MLKERTFMKSLIIGANGGVGQHLVRKLKVRQNGLYSGCEKYVASGNIEI